MLAEYRPYPDGRWNPRYCPATGHQRTGGCLENGLGTGEGSVSAGRSLILLLVDELFALLFSFRLLGCGFRGLRRRFVIFYGEQVDLEHKN